MTRFQSTPPLKAVTYAGLEAGGRGSISIHTAPKGGDDGVSYTYGKYMISIHTAPKGGDQAVTNFISGIIISIHTAPKGGDEMG